MKRTLTILIWLVVLSWSHASAETPSCESLKRDQDLCRLVEGARAKAADISLSIYKRQGQLWRESVLVGKTAGSSVYEEIKISLPLFSGPAVQPVVLTESDPPYRVERLRGTSFLKMAFRVVRGDEPVEIYAAKHLSLPPQVALGNVKKLLSLAETKLYLAVHPALLGDGISEAGHAMLLAGNERALTLLRERGVRSRVYPDRLVADLVKSRHIVNLTVAEQTDFCLLVVRNPGCRFGVPVPAFQEYGEMARSIPANIFWNGLDAYAEVKSGGAALGAHQFTNNTSKGKLGTYDEVHRVYPKALLDPNFERGAREYINSAMAAALLIDLELSRPKIPGWMRELYLSDSDSAILVAAVAYNGGRTQAANFVQALGTFLKEQDIEEFAIELFPWEDFLQWLGKEKNPLVPETFGYIQKYRANLEHLKFN